MKRALPILLALSACGDDATLAIAEGRTVLDIRVDTRGTGVEELCGQRNPAQQLQAQAFPSDGSAPIRLPADCSTSSTVDLSILPPGVYDVEVLGLGYLRGLANQVLYGGGTRVQVPGASTLVLEPEVAFVEVTWRAPEDAAPCREGVDEFRVSVASDGGAEPLMGSSADCGSEGFEFVEPVRPGAWTVEVTGLERGQVRLARSEMRILDAGHNMLDLTLEPTGAQLLVDWSFVGASGSNRGCDLAGVDEVDIDVHFRDEQRTFEVPCAAERPRPLDGLRLPLGAFVRIEARAEGAALYRGKASFTVERQGAYERLLLLEPFGQVDIAWSLAEVCSGALELELSIADLARESVFFETADVESYSLLTPELPFGDYVLLVQAVDRADCGARAEFRVDAAYVELPELVIGTAP